MQPQFAVKVVHGLSPGEPGFETVQAEMDKASSVWDIASVYAMQSVVRPQDSREYLIRMLDVHELRLSRGVGKHLMQAWPTSY